MSAILIPFPQLDRVVDDELEAVAEDLVAVAHQVRPVAVAWVLVDQYGVAHSSWEALAAERPALLQGLMRVFGQVDDLHQAERAEELLRRKKQQRAR